MKTFWNTTDGDTMDVDSSQREEPALSFDAATAILAELARQ